MPGAPVDEIDAMSLTFKPSQERAVWSKLFRKPAVGGRLSRVAGQDQLSGRLPCRCDPTNQALIERLFNARRHPIPGSTGFQVRRRLHAVVQYPTHHHEKGGLRAAYEDVAGLADQLRACCVVERARATGQQA
jgi:hypothetical protein